MTLTPSISIGRYFFFNAFHNTLHILQIVYRVSSKYSRLYRTFFDQPPLCKSLIDKFKENLTILHISAVQSEFKLTDITQPTVRKRKHWPPLATLTV